jgi:hypothetical protein
MMTTSQLCLASIPLMAYSDLFHILYIVEKSNEKGSAAVAAGPILYAGKDVALVL